MHQQQNTDILISLHGIWISTSASSASPDPVWFKWVHCTEVLTNNNPFSLTTTEAQQQWPSKEEETNEPQSTSNRTEEGIPFEILPPTNDGDKAVSQSSQQTWWTRQVPVPVPATRTDIQEELNQVQCSDSADIECELWIPTTTPTWQNTNFYAGEYGSFRSEFESCTSCYCAEIPEAIFSLLLLLKNVFCADSSP